MPEPRIWIDTTIPDHPLLARCDRPPRSDTWRLAFGHAYTSTWTNGVADGWDEEHNGDPEYSLGFNAGTDLAAFHRSERSVVDMEEVL